MDTSQMERSENSEIVNRNHYENDIPPTMLRMLQQRYGDIDPEAFANISRNPEAVAQLESMGALDTRGKWKKLTGLAFILAMLKIIF